MKAVHRQLCGTMDLKHKSHDRFERTNPLGSVRRCIAILTYRDVESSQSLSLTDYTFTRFNIESLLNTSLESSELYLLGNRS